MGNKKQKVFISLSILANMIAMNLCVQNLGSESDQRFEIYKIKRFDKNNNLTGVRRYDYLGCITESWNIDPTKPKAPPLKKQIQESRKRLAKSGWWAKRNKKQGEIL